MAEKPAELLIASLADMADGAAQGFDMEVLGKRRLFFVVRLGDAVHAPRHAHHQQHRSRTEGQHQRVGVAGPEQPCARQQQACDQDANRQLPAKCSVGIS